MHRRKFTLAAVLLAAALPASAQLGDLGKKLGLGSAALPNDKIAAGLKEALQVGTGNAVNLTGKKDGYFKNEAIKIVMPPKLRLLESGLRGVGYGSQVDEFILSMNRAAESAAPQAKKIFVGAITEMTIQDARKILSGGDTAATDYFKSRTTARLTEAFRPEVAKATSEVGVTKQYKQLVGRFQGIPVPRVESIDIDQYVVGKALDGLFYVVGQEEKKIRTNPQARVTDLLKEVFRK